MLNVRLLVLGIFGGIAIFWMNSAYADDTSILDTFEKKKAVSLETHLKTDQPENNRPKTNKSKTKESLTDIDSTGILESHGRDDNDDNVSNKKQKNSRTGQRKTHYGIGYEYRKSLQNRSKRAEWGERSGRIQRPERIDRPERIERPERVERPDRIERPERPGR